MTHANSIFKNLSGLSWKPHLCWGLRLLGLSAQNPILLALSFLLRLLSFGVSLAGALRLFYWLGHGLPFDGIVELPSSIIPGQIWSGWWKLQSYLLVWYWTGLFNGLLMTAFDYCHTGNVSFWRFVHIRRRGSETRSNLFSIFVSFVIALFLAILSWVTRLRVVLKGKLWFLAILDCRKVDQIEQIVVGDLRRRFADFGVVHWPIHLLITRESDRGTVTGRSDGCIFAGRFIWLAGVGRFDWWVVVDRFGQRLVAGSAYRFFRYSIGIIGGLDDVVGFFDIDSALL